MTHHDTLTSPRRAPMASDTLQVAHAGFTAGTKVMTLEGERDIEDLSAGERILTKDYGAQQLKFIAFQDVDLIQTPERAPVCIPADAFGKDRPYSPVFLAPEQRIAIRHQLFDTVFGAHEVLAQARDLVGHRGIHRSANLRGITYILLGFSLPQIVYCGNLAVGLVAATTTQDRRTLSTRETQLACSFLPQRLGTAIGEVPRH